MRVLVACETSGTVRNAFRARGHDAFSCDILPADDGSMWHLHGDCLIAIQDGTWDLVIAHPPCTHLASSGARHWEAKKADGRQAHGISLFMAVVAQCSLHARSFAIENPIGIMSTKWRKPDQIIQPWMFGLPLLVPTNDVHEEMMALPIAKRNRIHYVSPSKDRWKIRSKTYRGIADAMASQWGG